MKINLALESETIVRGKEGSPINSTSRGFEQITCEKNRYKAVLENISNHLVAKSLAFLVQKN